MVDQVEGAQVVDQVAGVQVVVNQVAGTQAVDHYWCALRVDATNTQSCWVGTPTDSL